MTIETDQVALSRANLKIIGTENFFNTVGVVKPKAVFFVYMRLNNDGSFAVYRYYYEGDGTLITSDLDPNIKGSVGYYAKEMAMYARPSTPNDGRFEYHGRGLENFMFPSRYSYCVFFMDDIHWKFLLDGNGKPVVVFNGNKGGSKFDKHDKAFTTPELLLIDMPIFRTPDSDTRQAFAMINRMRNDKDKDLKEGEIEHYCFDIWMRVHYAGSTNGLTLIIDPTGDNQGPPH